MTGEDWSSIAPGTPIGMTIGWAFADGRAAMREAFAAADRAMLQAKPAASRKARLPRPNKQLSVAARGKAS